MAYYIVHALDAPNMVDARAANRSEHRARLRNHDHPLTVRVGGPLLDDAGAMCGTTLIVEADDKQSVSDYVQGDPYTKAGVYNRIDIHPFVWGLTQLKDT